QGRGEHRAQAAAGRELAVADDVPRVAVQIRALDRAALLHRESGDAFSDPDPDHPAGCLEIEARRRGQLARCGIEREQAARLDAEDLARLAEDQPDGLADVEALIHGAASLVERLGLARPS